MGFGAYKVAELLEILLLTALIQCHVPPERQELHLVFHTNVHVLLTF